MIIDDAADSLVKSLYNFTSNRVDVFLSFPKYLESSKHMLNLLKEAGFRIMSDEARHPLLTELDNRA